MTKITDLFSVGESVSWITVNRSGKVVDIRRRTGVIEEIQGKDAMIRINGRRYRKRIPLVELENNTRPYSPAP